MCGSDIFLGLIAILFPPIAVWVKRGICSADSLINIALCCLAYLPGLLHAWYIISISPDPTYEQVAQQDAERGTVTYYYVQTTGQPRYAAPQQGQQGYGTVNASAPNAQFPQQQTKPQPRPAPADVQPPTTSQAGPSNGTDDAPPPSYHQATGDNKVQGP
ncbi:Plasma membrane proteolipid 3 [Cercospora zeina]